MVIEWKVSIAHDFVMCEKTPNEVEEGEIFGDRRQVMASNKDFAVKMTRCHYKNFSPLLNWDGVTRWHLNNKSVAR